MSERWKIEDHGEYFDVTAPNGGNAAFFGGTGDYIGRFAYFAIHQLLADLRERDERIAGLESEVECVRMNFRQATDRAEQAERERDELRKQNAALAYEANRFESACGELRAERDDLAARLRAIEGQEPVAHVVRGSFVTPFVRWIGEPSPNGTQLYAAPVAPRPVVLPDFDAWAAEQEIFTDYPSGQMKQQARGVWDACVEEVKRLNGVGE